MNINEEKTINEIIKKTEDDNRELLDYICYFLLNYFYDLLNNGDVYCPSFKSYRNCILNYDKIDLVKKTRLLILEKTLDYYNKKAIEKNCLPKTVAEVYNESAKLQEEYLTLEDYVLSLYKNNCDLFDEKEWKDSYIEINEKEDFIAERHNISLSCINNIIESKGKIFKTLLKRRLDKEFYITEDNNNYAFQLRRYLDEVYYSEKNNNFLSNDADKNLTKRI